MDPDRNKKLKRQLTGLTLGHGERVLHERVGLPRVDTEGRLLDDDAVVRRHLLRFVAGAH